MNTPKLPTVNRIKQRAKVLKKEKGIKHTEALNLISKEYGFNNWKDFEKVLEQREQLEIPTPIPSNNFVAHDDVEMTDEDFKILEEERTEELPEQHKENVILNKRQLTKLGIEFSIFEPTKTGLNKSILDATQPVRTHFELEEFHYYSEQSQGPTHKVKKTSYLLTDNKKISSSSSFYRPESKKGDPRMWFGKLGQICDASDQIAIIIKDDTAYLINLSKTLISESMKLQGSLIKKFLDEVCHEEFSIAEELLNKLKELAKNPMPALRSGSTGVGFTLETMLGIKANSSKEPDYKGIELKSGRGGKNRTTLFAQVPDWSISPCKKSAEILNKYGYQREDDFKLYCTLSTQKDNSQGLSFIYNETTDELQEWHEKANLVAVWPGKLLRSRLKEKHAETFWVEAESVIVDGVEHFYLKNVTHTKAPLSSQLMPLLQSGVITMDHLIKRSGETNRVSEKGPLFKINKRDLDLLFPEPKTYSLV